MTDTSADVFVDTNVLVYACDASETVKQPIADAWCAFLWRTRRGRTSVQVLNEYYYTVTRKLRPGRSVDRAQAEVRDLVMWRPMPLGTKLIERAWQVQARFALSYWDSLIVAAAQAARCRFLLTEDLQDEQDLDGLIVLNPFTHPPESI